MNLIGMEAPAGEAGVDCEAVMVVDTMCRGTNMEIHYSPQMRLDLCHHQHREGVPQTEEWNSTPTIP